MKRQIVLFMVFASLSVYAHDFKDKITSTEIQQIVEIGKANRVPKSVTIQLMHEESGGYADAISHLTGEGYRSEGAFQIYTKPGNLDWLLWKFWKGNKEDFHIFDPIDNATLALAYLSWLHDRYGNWFLACVYFNHGNITGYSKETEAYALRIINAH